MRVLVTGACGWLGSAVTRVLAGCCTVRGHDLRDAPGTEAVDVEHTSGDLGNFAVAQQAVQGADAVVHLVSGGGLSLSGPGDWISAGTGVAANIFEAAAEEGIKRVVLMSSGAVILGRRGATLVDDQTPPLVTSAYGMTKWLEEVVAGYYAAERGMTVPILRPWLIVDGPTMTFKGRDLHGLASDPYEHNGSFGWVDRSDVAEACRLALTGPLSGSPVFYLFASNLADRQFDTTATRRVLGWEPRFRFDQD